MGIIRRRNGIEEHFRHIDRFHFISDPAEVIQTLFQPFFGGLFRHFRNIFRLFRFLLFDLQFKGPVGKSQNDQLILQPFFPQRQQISGCALPCDFFAVDLVSIIACKEICGKTLKEFFSIVTIHFLAVLHQLVHFHGKLEISAGETAGKILCFFPENGNILTGQVDLHRIQKFQILLKCHFRFFLIHRGGIVMQTRNTGNGQAGDTRELLKFFFIRKRDRLFLYIFSKSAAQSGKSKQRAKQKKKYTIFQHDRSPFIQFSS